MKNSSLYPCCRVGGIVAGTVGFIERVVIRVFRGFFLNSYIFFIEIVGGETKGTNDTKECFERIDFSGDE